MFTGVKTSRNRFFQSSHKTDQLKLEKHVEKLRLAELNKEYGDVTKNEGVDQ